MINYNEYREILEAKEVTIHNLLKHFKKNEIDYDAYGNIYINFKKETKELPILVAHLDNVLGEEDRKPVYSLDGKTIFCANTVGIGFDDKAGIIAIIELWRSIPNKPFRIIFTANEEVGGIGAEYVDAERMERAAYILELDRKGGHDIIQTSGFTRLCSESFAKKWEELGFKRATGTFTDLNKFKPKIPKVEMCNLSIGYYNPHQKSEYLDIKEFENVIEKVKQFIIENKKKQFEDTEEFIEEQNNYGNYDYNYRNYQRFNDTMMSKCDCCGKYGITTWNEDIGMYLCDECNDWYEDDLYKGGKNDNGSIQ